MSETNVIEQTYFAHAPRDAVSGSGSYQDHASANGNAYANRYASLEFFVAFAAGATIIFAYPYAAWSWEQSAAQVLGPATLYAAVLVAMSVAKQRYLKCVTKPVWYAATSAITDNLRAAAVLIGALFLLKASGDLSRASVVFQIIVVTVLTTAARCAWSRWAHRRLDAGRLTMSMAVFIGEHSRLDGLASSKEFVARMSQDGVRVVSTLGWPKQVSDAARQSLADSVVALSRAGVVDSVVILPGAGNDVTERLVAALAETPLTIYVAPLASATMCDNFECRIGGLPAIKITNSPLYRLGSFLKRGFDIVVSLLMLFLLGPLFACVAVAIVTESPGPVFFRQTRHGYGNRHFKVFKFRSMRVMEDGKAFRQAKKNDPRITAVGSFIRRTNIDELPQLLNVLLGDMSLVGPRPHPIALNDDFASRIRQFHRRHNIRPGITGWAQVNGYRGETDTYEKMKGRVEHDLWYIDNWSFSLDLRILVSTVFSPTAYRNAG